MQEKKYQQLKKQCLPLIRPNNIRAGIHFFMLFFFSTLAIAFSLSEQVLIWFISQIFLGIFILQWLIILHDFGHNNYFSNSKLNKLAGHIASLFCILPFYPWRYIHRSHHLWTGWKDKDPTMNVIIPRELTPARKNFVNFCWKNWVPVFSLSFSFSNFWNLSKLYRMYPEGRYKWRNTFSILLLPFFYLFLITLIGGGPFIKIWAFAYFVFLFLGDPLLLAQHSGVPQKLSRGEKIAPLHFRDQEQHTRTLIFPTWMSRFLLLGFNNHIVHHLFPSMPGYHLWQVQHSSSQNINWWKWLKSAKAIPAHQLLFSEEMNLEVKFRTKGDEQVT